MGRPVYPHEMCDPDFSWLVSNFKEQHPEFILVESTFLPIVLILVEEVTSSVAQLALPDGFVKDPPIEVEEL